MKQGFASCDGKGFYICFPNGLTLSTQFGGGNYGSNYDMDIGAQRKMVRNLEATTVEIAVFRTDGKGEWQTKQIAKAAGLPDPGDDVMGYVPFEDWLKIFDATRSSHPAP